MDKEKIYLLEQHRESIVKDLGVEFIIDKLISSNAISLLEGKYIIERDQRYQASALLDVLLEKGNKSYVEFVNALKKDYDWLWEKLQVNDCLVPPSVLEDSIEDSLSRGDVPRLPIHYVHRLELGERVIENLKCLKRHKMLVLHGMPGSGKSSLAIGALRNNPSLVNEKFGGKVFWINVGDCQTEEHIVDLQLRMYRKVVTGDGLLDGSTYSSASLNRSSQSLIQTSDVWKDYKDTLKGTFEENNFRESLIVIDDLRNEEVLKAFDIGCKILITTQDSTYTKEFQPQILQIENQLTELESLQLIGSAVMCNINDLPEQAKKIHHLCKGAPLLMALLGGMLADDKEALKHDKSHWNYYVNKLKKKDKLIPNLFRSQTNSKPYSAIEMCINSLNDDSLIASYKKLVVLPDNAKISTRALSVVMNLSEPKVKDIMKRLKHKSLIIEHYNVDLKSYQYEVHDVIMAYLRSGNNKEATREKNEQIKSLHSSLILRYKDMCLDNDLVNLPNDGYILHYVGYHIKNTGNVDNMWQLFKSLYSDLIFIGNKIRAAGPADVLLDFKIYSEHIKKDSDDNFITELTNFITRHGHDLHHYPNTDIVQSILQHDQGTKLHRKAMELASHPDNKEILHFQFQSEEEIPETNSTNLDVGDRHTKNNAINFIRLWMDYVLIGYQNGTITQWCFNDDYQIFTNLKIKSFFRHSEPVKCIAVSTKEPFVMASTSNTALNIWEIQDIQFDSQSENFDIEENGDNFPTCDNSYDAISPALHNYGTCCGVYWGHRSNVLMMFTNPGSTIILYNCDGTERRVIRAEENISITSGILSQDDSLIIFAYEKPMNHSHGIHVYNTTGLNLMRFVETEPLLMLDSIPGDSKSVLALTRDRMKKHTWKNALPLVLKKTNQVKTSNIEHTIIAKAGDFSDDYKFQAGCVAKDGSCIFISTTNFRILVYNFETKTLVWELNNPRGVIMSIDTCMDSIDDVHLLITKSSDDIIKLWNVPSSLISPLTNAVRKPQYSLKFDCIFDKRHLSSPSTASDIRQEVEGSPLRRAETLCTPSENNGKVLVRKTTSLDRRSLRPLNIKIISNLGYPDATPMIAVITDNYKVQLLRGTKVVAETIKSEIPITAVALSPCGQYLAYGLENGVVYKFVFKTRISEKIMNLNEHVKYLEFLKDEILVAAGKESGLSAYESYSLKEYGFIVKMIIRSGSELGSQELMDDIIVRHKRSTSDSGDSDLMKKSPTSLSSFSMIDGSMSRSYPFGEGRLHKISPVVKCFWLERSGLLCVTRDGSVKLWNLEDPRLISVLICKQHDFSVTCVSLKKKRHLLLCSSNGSFQIYNLDNRSDYTMTLDAGLYDSNSIIGNIVSCDISNDIKILAFGLSSGDIVLWDIRKKSIITKLKLHQTAVHCLKFSPNPVECEPNSSSPTVSSGKKDNSNDAKTPLVLVSLAGQIAWWNISSIVTAKTQPKRYSEGSAYHILTPRSATNNISSHSRNGNAENHFSFPEAAWECRWKGKRCRKNSQRKDLMACIKLIGDRAYELAVDDNFSRFVTIDRYGAVYIMNILETMKVNGHGS